MPGFAAGMIRHLHSLRTLERDHGWIHTLVEEAENERMHLLTFLQLRNPGPLVRAAVIVTQTAFTAAFCMAYLLSPAFCHRSELQKSREHSRQVSSVVSVPHDILLVTERIFEGC